MITKPIRVIESPGSPSENDLWLNGKVLKKFQNGQWVEISGGEAPPQLQTDWNQTDDTKPDYIKNKPTILPPYVVELTLDGATGALIPAEGSPSFQTVADAFKSGANVIFLVWESESYSVYHTVSEYTDSGGGAFTIVIDNYRYSWENTDS